MFVSSLVGVHVTFLEGDVDRTHTILRFMVYVSAFALKDSLEFIWNKKKKYDC